MKLSIATTFILALATVEAARKQKSGKNSAEPSSGGRNICEKRRGLAFEAYKKGSSGSSPLLGKVIADKNWPSQINSKNDMDELCSFNPRAPPNQGCWALYETGTGIYPSSSDYFADTGGQASKDVYEPIDEFCECLQAYDQQCMGRLPFGEPNGDEGFFFSRVVSGPFTTPENYGDFCEFGMVLNGDADYADANLSDAAATCGCLWVDAVEELIDNCFGNELGDFDY
mmetsp:Transcript_31652/g.46701  ORF Transcript_31652/g.46701 Transcript_31652/m.46701 type:complete len:228 (-) Transcript_31652:98-781(-)